MRYSLLVQVHNTKQNEEMDKYIKISEVFDQVIEHYGWNESDQSDTVDIESKKRNMRNKYNFLMKKVLYRNAKDFKNKGGNMILKSDAPIIRELIIYALKDDKDDPIVKWFNGKIDTSDPVMAYIIFQL